MPPTSTRRHRASEFALLAALVLLVAPFVWSSHFPEDEFTTLSNALRMLGGAVIYKDFFEFTAPFSHWLAAWTFALTGPTLVAARAVQGALLVLAGWQLYRLARALDVSPWASTLPGLLLVVALFRTLPGFNHHWVVIPFVLGALQAGMRGLASPRPIWWFLGGVAGGGAAITMQSDGPVVAVALAGAIVLNALLGGWRWRQAPLNLAGLALGFAAPIAAAAGYFLWNGGLQAAWHHVWEWPLVHYKVPGNNNDVKFATDLPALISTTAHWVNVPFWYAKAYHYVVLFAIPVLTAAGALAWGVERVFRRVWPGTGWTPVEARWGLVGLATVGFFALATRGRADYVHVAMYAVPAVLLAVAAADAWRRRAGELRHLPLLGLCAFFSTGLVLLADEIRQDPGAFLSAASPDQRLMARPAIRYLREHGQPGDRVVAAPYPGPYYVYGLPPGGRFTHIVPPEVGYNTEAEWRSFWDEILEKRPRYVVMSPWNGEAGLAPFLRHPLPGYREAARLGIEREGDPHRAVIYERIGDR